MKALTAPFSRSSASDGEHGFSTQDSDSLL
jgi:hypothetical protein